MSALGQKQTFASQQAMSALPPIATAKADIATGHVCFTPKSGYVRCRHQCLLRANSGHCDQTETPCSMRVRYIALVLYQDARNRTAALGHTLFRAEFFGHRRACDFGNDTKRKINTSGDATSGDYISVFHHPCLLVCSTDKRQKIRIGPVRRSSAPLQKTGHT